jgi:hypothetical protein
MQYHNSKTIHHFLTHCGVKVSFIIDYHSELFFITDKYYSSNHFSYEPKKYETQYEMMVSYPDEIKEEHRKSFSLTNQECQELEKDFYHLQILSLSKKEHYVFTLNKKIEQLIHNLEQSYVEFLHKQKVQSHVFNFDNTQKIEENSLVSID